MIKVFNPIFTIKPIVKQKRDSKLKNSIISRKCLAVVKIIDNRIEEDRATEIEEILEIVKAPDFPTGGVI